MIKGIKYRVGLERIAVLFAPLQLANPHRSACEFRGVLVYFDPQYIVWP